MMHYYLRKQSSSFQLSPLPNLKRKFLIINRVFRDPEWVKKIRNAFSNRDPLRKQILGIFGPIPPESEFNKELFEKSITRKLIELSRENDPMNEAELFEREELILKEVQKSREQLRIIKSKENALYEGAFKTEQKNQAIDKFNTYVDSLNQHLDELYQDRYYFNFESFDTGALDIAQQKCLEMIECYSDPSKSIDCKENARLAALGAINATKGIPRQVKINWAEENIEKIDSKMDSPIEEVYKRIINDQGEEGQDEGGNGYFETKLKEFNFAYSLLTKLSKEILPVSLEHQSQDLSQMKAYLQELEGQVSSARTALEHRLGEIDQVQFYHNPHKVEHTSEIIDIGSFIPEDLHSAITELNTNLKRVGQEFAKLKSTINNDKELVSLIKESKDRSQKLEKLCSNLAFYQSERFKQIEKNLNQFINELDQKN